eukprot:Opistho-2@41875
MPPKQQSVIDEKSGYKFEFSDITYQVEKKVNKESSIVTLLDGISGIVRPGEMLAIMGSSGAGKSTLLDVLAGNVVSDLLTGSILVNGAPVDKSFRRIAGYVMQDDALFPMLTVRETPMYSALI